MQADDAASWAAGVRARPNIESNEAAMTQKRRGTIKKWKDESGFGFIAPDDRSPDLFFHHSEIRPTKSHIPKVGETCTFELGTGRDGKPVAVKVEFVQ